MLTEEWDNWVKRHAAAFSLTWEGSLDMFAEWQTVFMLVGYTADELNEATTFLILHPPDKPAGHLRAIQDRIFARRKDLAEHNDKQAERPGAVACSYCGGTGWVSVPHLRYVKDGQWFPPWYTFVVVCGCSKGERIASTHGENKPRSMTLESYTIKNPNWQSQLRQRRLEQQAMHKAEAVTAVALQDKKARAHYFSSMGDTCTLNTSP